MEYKRHRNIKKRKRLNRSRRRHQTQSRPNSAPKTILILLLTGGIIYMFSASFLGTYLAENFVAPIFEAFKKDPSDSDDGSLAVSLSTDKNAVVSDVTLPGTTLYALQMGIYASPDNAQKQSAELKSKGAAGYILSDDDKFRVLSAGYNSQDDAKSVKDRLTEGGTDCAVFTLSCDSHAFKISTDKSSTDSLATAFSSFKTALDSLSDAILNFDKDTKSISECQKECTAILETFKGDMEIITNNSDIPTALEGMLSCYDIYCTQLSALSSSEHSEKSTFSSAMKYAQLCLADEYIKFSVELSSSL